MHGPVSITPDAVYDDGTLHLALGLTPSTLAKARRAGELRFTRKGNRTLYLGQWVLEWLRTTAQAAEGRQGVAGGASVKTAQELARHSDPRLTIGRYSHARLHDLTGALESLPDLQPQDATTERQALQATGTDGNDSKMPVNRQCANGKKGSETANRGESHKTEASGRKAPTEPGSGRPNVLKIQDLATKKPRLARRGNKAEGTGLVAPAFPNSLLCNGLEANGSARNELGQSGCSRLFPVVSGRGGRPPGQNRDKFFSLRWLAWHSLSYVAMIFMAVGMVQAGGVRPGPRSRAEIERERRELYERTAREVDQIVAEFHDKLPRRAAKAVGAIYCRYSTRFQDSIADQVRKILEDAVRRGVFVSREYVLFDLAVRGCKSQRAGLDQLRQLLRSKNVSVVMFFATNRLFRKVHRTLEFVEEEIVERGIDAVFVKSGVDTSDTDRWRMLLTFHSMMDEFVVGMYADNIRAAHEGLLEKRLVFGTISYGYSGEPIDGQITRRGRPRRRLIIDPVTSGIVNQVFEWYVADLVKIDEIIRRLNDDSNIPLPPRCTSGMWTRLAVKKILTNSRYRGFWQYGVTESVWISSKDYSRQTVRREPLKDIQIEEFRIVSDEIWFDAQKRLAEETHNGGRPPRDGDRRRRPRVLNGMLWCPEHNRPLQASGPHGRCMICPSCRRFRPEKRYLFTHLNRVLALQLTCERLAELVRADEDLVQQIIRACRDEAEALQRPDPARIEQLRSRDDQLTLRIRFIVNHVGDTEEDQREAAAILGELRQQRAELRAEIASLEDDRGRQVKIPSEHQVRDLSHDLGGILTSAARGNLGDEIGQVRAVISELTGGRIELHQMGERKARRGWLQGRFQVDVASVVIDKLTGVRPVANNGGVEVVIDYRAEMLIDRQAEEAKRLWDEDLLNKEIAAKMGVKPSYVTKLLHHWFDSRGLPRPDNRKRRAELENKQVNVPTYKRIADKVVRLVDEGMSNLAIARRFKVSDTTVAAAIEYWFQSHGQPVPTTADRRRKMLRRAKEMYDSGMLIKDIAAQLGYTARGLKLALDDYMAEIGERLPDGRARRGNVNSGESANGHAANDNDTPVDQS